MRNVLRCRRGSAAFATVVAMIPLIGVLALGGEAGSWYVTQQRAQNAADAAAYSGALQAACLAAGTSCSVSNTVVYRGKQFAAQNTFCNSGDTSYPGSKCATSLPSGISQNVQIASLSSWGGTAGNYVQATVSQTQPGYLAKLLGVSTVTIGATAVAKVDRPQHACVLALSGAISFHDSAVTVNAPTCGFGSNATGTGFDFNANPTVNVASMSTSGTCSGSSSYCNSVSTLAPATPNPFTALDTAISALDTSTWKSCGGLTPYTAANPCLNSGSGQITVSGVYFFSSLSLNGNKSLSTAAGVTATVILLPSASLRMVGGSSITITAQSSVPASQLPTQLQSVAGLLSDMAFYDTESGTPKINGNPTISVDGIIYMPNVDLTFKGHPNLNLTNSVNHCAEIVAASIELIGSPHLDISGCPASVVPTTQLVKLVQ